MKALIHIERLILALLLLWGHEFSFAASKSPYELIKFAGQQVRAVWVQHHTAHSLDVFSEGSDLELWGVDTGDGLGNRQILKAMGNYSRPVLTPDGLAIVYSVKSEAGSSSASPASPLIYRTDWSGTTPVCIGTGCVTDVWRDEKTAIDWVYAAQQLDPSSPRTLTASRLVRMKLSPRSEPETIVEGLSICPDNIQLSRSGAAFSAQAPWPKAGLFKMAPGAPARFIKRAEGCWTSMAPDDTELLWVFNTDHRSVTMVRRDAKERWKVTFKDAPGLNGGEVYHPRWSNHPHYVCLTGPQATGQAARPDSGAPVPVGQVILGHLSDDARQVTEWFQLTDGDRACAYPDLWIAGGGSHELTVKAGTK